MSYKVPNFNLTASIWRVNGTGGAYAAPDVTTLANLSPGRRIMIASPQTTAAQKEAIVDEALLPALTDVRATWNALGPDLMEIPAGSKRFYEVVGVHDVGKGFPNEYRLALIVFNVNGNLSLGGGPFPVPTPLP